MNRQKDAVDLAIDLAIDNLLSAVTDALFDAKQELIDRASAATAKGEIGLAVRLLGENQGISEALAIIQKQMKGNE